MGQTGQRARQTAGQTAPMAPTKLLPARAAVLRVLLPFDLSLAR